MQQPSQLEWMGKLLEALLLVISTGYLLTAIPQLYRAIAHSWDRLHDYQGLMPGIIEFSRDTEWDSFGGSGPTIGASVFAVPIGMAIYFSGAVVVLSAVFGGTLLGYHVPHEPGLLLSGAIAVPIVLVAQKRLDTRFRRSRTYRGW